jgi:hypothetical protein
MSVIFQLFCAEDLQKLEREELLDLKNKVMEALKDINGKAIEGNPPALSLKISDKTDLPDNAPQKVNEALNKRFHEVSHQIKSPPLKELEKPFRFGALRDERNSTYTQRKEDLILEWSISCEVNNFEFYYPLLEAKKAAYAFFAKAMIDKGETTPEGQPLRPKGPDSPYSPFNPRHPLYRLFYDL